MAEAAVQQPGLLTPNARRHYDVTRKDLPLHCPMDGMSLWNSHPRVYLPIEDHGEVECPYCSAIYKLVD
ncbi:MAG: zinc-finger domain-containing protein [Gammaproteobacteria bacterium]|nr:zinc-finger domain-containing protein [Gammaproteobacteria bacterium]